MTDFGPLSASLAAAVTAKTPTGDASEPFMHHASEVLAVGAAILFGAMFVNSFPGTVSYLLPLVKLHSPELLAVTLAIAVVIALFRGIYYGRRAFAIHEGRTEGNDQLHNQLFRVFWRVSTVYELVFGASAFIGGLLLTVANGHSPLPVGAFAISCIGIVLLANVTRRASLRVYALTRGSSIIHVYKF